MEAYSLQAKQLHIELDILKEFHWTQESALELIIQRESFLEVELLALSDLKSEEDRMDFHSEFTIWNVRRFTLKQAKDAIEDIDAKIYEAQEIETMTRDNLLPLSD
ncbi:hypothetical protein HAX54_050708 [Datura stramonium]|uniref:Uncharacterized protein n=1 Tax=Datura stramonium TaxID=4076 RepID=A0ABS8WQJ7_DATST|nr:hypothetical protein [Datura stramonium]